MMKFCSLTHEHLPAVSALHAQCFEKSWDAIAWGDLMHSFAEGAVLKSSSKIEAVLLWRKAADQAEVLTMMTAEQARRKGAAAKLLEDMAVKLKAERVESIFLEVRADNIAAISLYQAKGYQQQAVRPNYYSTSDGKKCDALVLRKML